jgi:formylglycine-generating enzyme required for sulfatase activity
LREVARRLGAELCFLDGRRLLAELRPERSGALLPSEARTWLGDLSCVAAVLEATDAPERHERRGRADLVVEVGPARFGGGPSGPRTAPDTGPGRGRGPEEDLVVNRRSSSDAAGKIERINTRLKEILRHGNKRRFSKENPMTPCVGGFCFLLASALLACSCQTAGQTTNAAREPSGVANEAVNSIGMKFVRVPKGTFAMGSPRSDRNADLDEQQHEVTVSRDYFIGAFECTQAEYERVMGKNPSQFQDARSKESSARHPVERVSWNDAVEFCRRLSELPAEKAAGRSYRLPTEAEWERACRGGSADIFAFGNDAALLGEYAWYESNGGGQTHPVGQKRPNAFGIYDMHGNAWEWCADWYVEHSSRPVVDPTGPANGTDRVYRGGSWNYAASYCRSANRTSTGPNFEGFDFLSISFRVVMTDALAK